MKDFVLWLAFLCLIFIVFPLGASILFKNDNNVNPAEYTVTLYDSEKNTVSEIDLEEYLVGVVSAEMPASFSPEALKAQSVAARSYSIRKINSDTAQHHGADLCTDYAHCQAYVDKAQSEKNWKGDYEKNLQKIQNAVEATAGEYLSYGDEVAVAVFHSCSNGMTEKSADVWGGEIPYLTNVSSEGDFERKDYCAETEFTVEEFKQKISEAVGEPTEDAEELMGNCTYTSGGNVNTIVLAGHELKGTDVRKIFGLRSTAFEIAFADGKVVFTVYGNGHGVGMSQYGADAMAKKGITYSEILSHYYPGTVFDNMYKQRKK